MDPGVVFILQNFTFLLYNKILDWSILGAFVDNTIRLAKVMIFVLVKVTSIFSFSNNVFKRLYTRGC